MSDGLMRYQAREIERTLRAKKLTVRVTGGYMGHRLTVYELAKPAHVDLSKVLGQSEELALALGVSSCRIGRRNGSITVEIPRRDPVTVQLTRLQHEVLSTCDAQAGPREPATPVVGVDAVDDTPLVLPLSSPNVGHVLITGTTGSGKTVLARAMIASLATANTVHDLGLVLIDPKRRGYRPFAGLPHLRYPITHEPAEAAGVLAWAVGLMERRDREGVSAPSVVVFIDELADLIQVEPEIEAQLTRLTQRGREAGVHVVACTQKPTAGVIGSLVKANFPCRFVGSVVDNTEAYYASGRRATGAELLLGKGDFIAVVGGDVVRFQGAYISEAEISELVTRLRGGLPASAGQTGRPAVRDKSRPSSSSSTGTAEQTGRSAVIDFVQRFRERQDSDAGSEPVNKKPPTDAMVEFALGELEEHGDVSQRAVRRFHKQEYGSDCNPRRAQAAIDRALERRNDGTGRVSVTQNGPSDPRRRRSGVPRRE